MTTMWGADTEALETMAKQLLQAAEVLGTIQRSTRAGLHASPWSGPDAETFRSSWDRSHGPRLGDASQFLREAAERLALNASQQQAASSASPFAGALLPFLLRPPSGGWADIMPERLWPARPGFPGLWPRPLPADPLDMFGPRPWWGGPADPFTPFQPLFPGLRPWGGFPGGGGGSDDWSSVLRERWDGVSQAGGLYESYRFVSGMPESAASGPMAVIGGAVHAGDLAFAIRDGDVDKGIRAGIDLVFDGVGSKIPQVAAGKAAWDLGYSIGKGASNWLDTNFDIHQHHVDHVMQREYGTTDLTPSQASELAHRYDGVSGFGNYVSDGAKNLVDNVKKVWPW